MMDLVHSHKFTSLWEQQKRKEWKFDLNKMVSDRVGKRVGVFGYGSIGRQGESTFSLYYQYEITTSFLHILQDICRTTSLGPQRHLNETVSDATNSQRFAYGYVHGRSRIV